MEALTNLYFGQPTWLWITVIVIVAMLLVFDLGFLHKGSKEIGLRESLSLSAGYIVLGLGFSGFVWVQLGEQAWAEYVAGFVVAKTHSLDNVLVIAIVFLFFSIPRQYHRRVLFWSILGVIALRAIMLGLGVPHMPGPSWLLYVYAALLVIVGAKILWRGNSRGLPVDSEVLQGERFIVRQPRAKTAPIVAHMSPLFLALVTIEVANTIVAVELTPAIFAITSDPYIVYTSNLFGILGLRALYLVLSAALRRFAYLTHALAILLIFIGSEILLADLFGLAQMPVAFSVGVPLSILGGGIAYSLWRPTAPTSPGDKRGE